MADSRPAERTGWIDICKGICIVLVVFGHISGGLEAGGNLQSGSFWLKIRSWVYLFHMPAFFALSGIFAGKSTSLSAGDFLIGKIRTIAYPYVVWTAIIIASQFTMRRFVNNPPDLHRASLFLLEPYGYGLWFLYALFIISLCYYLLASFKIPSAGIAVIALTLSIMANFNCFIFWPILNTALSFFAYYACTASFSTKILLAASVNHKRSLPLIGICLLLVMTLIFFVDRSIGQITHLLEGFLGTAGVMCLAKGFDQFPTSYLWSLLGMFSLEIYLGHPLWGTIARVVLLKSGIHLDSILVLGGVFIGIGGSLAVGIWCRTWHFPYLFRCPGKTQPPR